MNNSIKNILIGSFVAIAIGLIVGMILFIQPATGDGKQELRIYFTNISGITNGTRVNLAGRTIGEVDQISQVPDARRHVPTKDGDAVYFYEITVKIDSKVTIYTTDTISTKTIGLLGDTVIAITPIYLPNNIRPTPVTYNTPMYAKSGDAIEETFKELSNLANEMDKTFQKVNDWLDTNSDNLSVAVEYFGEALKEIRFAVKDFNELQVMADVKSSLANFAKGMGLIDDALQKIKDGDGFDDLPLIVHNIRAITQSVDTITNTIADGKGSIGPLIMNDEIYFKVNTLLTKANITLNDINQYGLLYSYNTDWKKTRLKKITDLNAIRSPQEFRNYYSKDLDEMNRAISRIGQISSSCDTPYFQSEKFTKEFKQLQDMLKELQSSLNRVQEELAYPNCESSATPACIPPVSIPSQSCPAAPTPCSPSCQPSCPSPALKSTQSTPPQPSQNCPKKPQKTSIVSPLEELKNFLRERVH